jgi:hypothetical protein
MTGLCLAVSAGCGGSAADDLPELGLVTGVVTLDGQPLSEAMITFEPTTGGSFSSGTTDETGTYELLFNADHNGAVIGTHKVTIIKHDGEAGPNIVPMKYNERTTLTA